MKSAIGASVNSLQQHYNMSSAMLELCSQSELWRLCSTDTLAIAAREAELASTSEAPTKTQTLPDP